MELNERVAALVESVRQEFAPDPRVSVFEVGFERDGGELIVAGATSEPAALEALRRRIGTLDVHLRVRDRVERLPRMEREEEAHALVTAPVAPMLAGPMIAETHVSQSLMGHTLTVLRERGPWLHCRAVDGYLGWVHRGYVRRVDEATARAWETGADGIACVSLGAELTDDAGVVVARLPWGTQLLTDGDGHGRLASGMVGRVVGEVVPLAARGARFPADGEALVHTAGRWLGAPYLWGGLTPAGVDCSGLSQVVYRTHGIELPRDSDQQAREGVEVDPGDDFSRLRPGDLLFFAEDAGRITHVTMSEGGSRIVHASLGNGGVWRNNLAGGLPYERELRAIFVCARRLIPTGP